MHLKILMWRKILKKELIKQATVLDTRHMMWSCLDAPKNLKIYKISRHIESYDTCMEY